MRRFAFGPRSAVPYGMIQGYLDFSGLYRSMMQTLVLYSYIWLLLSVLCFISASSFQDIGAICSVSDFLACPLFRTLL
jgi:hypothetical protein